jgi:hypothetical protein
MADPSNGGPMHKGQLNDGLGKSTLINPSVSIPMPPGAAQPRPPTPASQGQGGQAGSGQSASATNRNG